MWRRARTVKHLHSIPQDPHLLRLVEEPVVDSAPSNADRLSSLELDVKQLDDRALAERPSLEDGRKQTCNPVRDLFDEAVNDALEIDVDAGASCLSMDGSGAADRETDDSR